MSNERNILLITYENVFNLLKYRGYTDISTPHTDQTLLDNINNKRFVEVKAKMPDGNTVSLFLFVPNYSFAKSDMLKFLKTNAKTVTGRVILLVDNKKKDNSRTAIGKKKDLSTRQEKVRDAIYKYVLDPHFIAQTGVSAYVEVIDYACLAFNMPKSISFIPYVIVSKEELSALVTYIFRQPSKYPTVMATDLSVIWCGAKGDDVVMRLCPSETAGDAMALRRVLHPKVQYTASAEDELAPDTLPY